MPLEASKIHPTRSIEWELRCPTRDTGFTVLELLVVILIVGFISAIAMRPEWHRSDAAELKSAALTLASDLRRTRSWAITHNTAALVHLDIDHHRYTQPGTSVTRDLLRSIAVRAALEDDAASRTSGTVNLRFWPDGTAIGADLLLTLHGQHQQVAIDWLTGHVTVSP